MDFIIGLPILKRRFDSILVVVDRFSKMIPLIACKMMNDATNISSLFIKEIVRSHGVPQFITSCIYVKCVFHFGMSYEGDLT